MVLVKAGNHGSYQYRSGCVYLFLVGSIQQKPVIPAYRGAEIWVLCPAMQRLVFEGGGR